MVRWIWTTLSRFWETDRSLSVLLVLLVTVGLVLPPLLPDAGPGVQRPLLDVVFSLLLVAGIVAVWGEGPWSFRVVMVFGVLAMPMRWAALVYPGRAMAFWSVATAVVALAVLAFVVLAKVFRPGLITNYRIQGAVAAYLLLGLVWAGVYECLAVYDPSAFTGVGTGNVGSAEWIYFSFVTLTTIGYGDISPLHPVARSLAVAESLTGQLYLAILISRLVALELESRRTG